MGGLDSYLVHCTCRDLTRGREVYLNSMLNGVILVALSSFTRGIATVTVEPYLHMNYRDF